MSLSNASTMLTAARTSNEYGFKSTAKKTIGTAVAKSHTARAAASARQILNASTAKSTSAATLAAMGPSRSDSSPGPREGRRLAPATESPLAPPVRDPGAEQIEKGRSTMFRARAASSSHREDCALYCTARSSTPTHTATNATTCRGGAPVRRRLTGAKRAPDESSERTPRLTLQIYSRPFRPPS